MTPREQEKIVTALKLGYRRKQNGEKVMLSHEMRRQFELRLSSASKLRGRFVYVSVQPFVIPNSKGLEMDNETGFKSYGPARRFGNRYVTEGQYKALIAEPEMIEA